MALCTLQSAIRHFGTQHKRCVKFLSTIFYPFWGRKYRIGIFGHRAAKTGKKSRRETFGTSNAKFRRKILFPSQHFRILPFWSEVLGWHALCTLQGATPALRNSASVVRKVLDKSWSLFHKLLKSYLLALILATLQKFLKISTVVNYCMLHHFTRMRTIFR